MRAFAFIAAATLAAALVACGGDDAPAPAPPAPATQAAADVPADEAVSVTPKVYFIHTEW